MARETRSYEIQKIKVSMEQEISGDKKCDQRDNNWILMI